MPPTLLHLNPNDLLQGPQPRPADEALNPTLQESIKASGILQPLAVYKSQEGYKILAGHRRHRAAVNLKLGSVPCYVYEIKPGDDLLALAHKVNTTAQTYEIGARVASKWAALAAKGHSRLQIAGAYQVAERNVNELLAAWNCLPDALKSEAREEGWSRGRVEREAGFLRESRPERNKGGRPKGVKDSGPRAPREVEVEKTPAELLEDILTKLDIPPVGWTEGPFTRERMARADKRIAQWEAFAARLGALAGMSLE